jgi:putative sigma-54 modulation protein
MAKKVEEENTPYRFTVIGRNIIVTDGIQQHIRDRLSKIERFDIQLMDIHIHLDIQKLEHSAEIVAKCGHLRVKVSAVSTDMYVSIDKAVERLQALLRRWKDRMHSHHNKAVDTEMQVHVINRPYSDEEEEEVSEFNREIESANEANRIYSPPVVIREKRLPLKTLTIEEAVMQMELSQSKFLVFRSEEDHSLRVIYPRKGSTYGVMLIG